MCASFAFVDTSAHPRAVDYYQMFHSEPIGASGAIPVDGIEGIARLTLEALLDGILRRVGRNENIVIVSHGQDIGLALPLVVGPPSTPRARAEALGMLGSDRETVFDGMMAPPVSVEQIQQSTHLAADQITRLRQKMNSVRALQLNHVALRACNIGTWGNALSTIRAFFGSRAISGPDIRDTFGSLNFGTPTTDARVWQSWERGHPDAFVEGSSPNRVGLHTTTPTARHAYTLSAIADSSAAVRAWASRHLLGGSSATYTSGAVPYHGLFNMSRAPGQSPIYFSGDASFRSHIVCA